MGRARDHFGDGEYLATDGVLQVFRQPVRMLKRFPGFGCALRGFYRDFPEWASRNACRIGKTAHLVGYDFGQAAVVAEAQGQSIARNIRKCGHKVITWREGGRAPVRTEKGPVLEVHVGIADDNRKYETPDEFDHGVFADFCPQYRSYVRIAVKLVLVVREFAEYLREILHVNGGSVLQAIKALYGEGLAFYRVGLFRQGFDAGNVDELVFRDGNAAAPCEFQHREFVLGHCLETCGRELDDPRSAQATCGNGQSAGGFHDGGEFQLHAGERKAQRLFAATAVVVCVVITRV